jgi:hypothetical protein
MSNATGTAHRLIKQHGDDAPEVAADRAAECEEAGKREEQTHWASVVVEAKLLLARDYSN